MLSTTLPAHPSINSDSGCRAIWVARDCAIDCESPSLFSHHFQPHTPRITRFISNHLKGRESNSKLVFFWLPSGRFTTCYATNLCSLIPLKYIFPTFRRRRKVISDIRGTRIPRKFAFLERIMEALSVLTNVEEPSIKFLKNYCDNFMYFVSVVFVKGNNSE